MLWKVADACVEIREVDDEEETRRVMDRYLEGCQNV